MESEDHFYLTLPSSASMDLHPDNKISDFTTELLQNVQLERERYEIGLCEMILDVDVENVTSEYSAFIISRSTKFVKEGLNVKNVGGLGVASRGNINFYWEAFSVERGKYNSLDELFGYFNTKFLSSRMCTDLYFHVKKVPNVNYEIVTLKSIMPTNLKDERIFTFHSAHWMRHCIYIPDISLEGVKQIDPSFRSTLQTYMIYSPAVKEYLEHSDAKAEAKDSIQLLCTSADLLETPGAAYVYSDIVEHQYVGNTKAPLLRVIHIPPGQKVLTFPTVHYLPMSKAQFGSIRVYIRDVEGKAYPFTNGTALCKLHIRRKKSQ
jgi:hypothetical protein